MLNIVLLEPEIPANTGNIGRTCVAAGARLHLIEPLGFSLSEKALKVYTEAEYEPDCYIMFGKESAGIPEEILLENQENCVRIPMIGGIRSLNLGNSAAVILYEALRQNGFAGMNLEGNLHRLEWK